MYNHLFLSKNTAPKQLVYGYLLTALDVYSHHRETLQIKDGKIPLHQGRDIHRVLYISGVALRLSKSHNQDALEIAQAIVSHLCDICGETLSVGIVPPGWIHLELRDSFLATWLQSFAVGKSYLYSSPPGTQLSVKLHSPARLFAIQYAHARCCSLLWLAHREGLIQLKTPSSDYSDNQPLLSLLTTESIPWLNHEAKLRLNHPAESSLIVELVKTVDELEFPDNGDKINWEKVGLDLSQAFEDFWCRCRIWGEVKTSLPELTQARLGLLIITQLVFRFLLVNKLGSVAPVEL
ncbi:MULTISPECIES: glutamate acetyltransferase [unclassified Anabaena]|uniref:glutamate acetyltransferase n=1 Tax=unclassified Anabaena TaxID=2619674 RepID=UPI00082C5B0B|nr:MULTISPECIES: glutamate acetyltransferase [unclassified Anabaena]